MGICRHDKHTGRGLSLFFDSFSRRYCWVVHGCCGMAASTKTNPCNLTRFMSVSSHFGLRFWLFLVTTLPKYYVMGTLKCVCSYLSRDIRANQLEHTLSHSLFIFYFVLPILPCKRKTLYRKSHNPSDEKPKTKLPNYVMCRALEHIYEFKFCARVWLYSCIKVENNEPVIYC